MLNFHSITLNTKDVRRQHPSIITAPSLPILKDVKDSVDFRFPLKPKIQARFASEHLSPINKELQAFKTNMYHKLQASGLNPDPDTQFYEVSAEQLITFVAQNGIPERYTHWSWHQRFEQLHDFAEQHNLWFSLALEGFLNHQPPQVYIPRFFTPEQKEVLITAGLIKSDFAKHNMYQAEAIPDILHRAAETAKLFDLYEDQYGRREVERWIDIALGFAALTDTQLGRPPSFENAKVEEILKQNTPLSSQAQVELQSLLKRSEEDKTQAEITKSTEENALPLEPTVDPYERQAFEERLAGSTIGKLYKLLPPTEMITDEWLKATIKTRKPTRKKRYAIESAIQSAVRTLNQIKTAPLFVDISKLSWEARDYVRDVCDTLERKWEAEQKRLEEERLKQLRERQKLTYYYTYLDYAAQMYPTYRGSTRQLREKDDEKRDSFQLKSISFHNLNEHDGLGYLIEHTPNLLPWQRHVLYKIRDELYFRNVQENTVKMSRGWTDFWLRKALLEDPPAEQKTSFTISPSGPKKFQYLRILEAIRRLTPEAINEYALAGLMFEHIVHAAKTQEEGLEAIKRIRNTYDDYNFIKNFLKEGTLRHIRDITLNPAFYASVLFIDDVRKGHRDAVPLRGEEQLKNSAGKIVNFKYNDNLVPLPTFKQNLLKRTINCGYPNTALATTNFQNKGHLLFYSLDPSDVINMRQAHQMLRSYAAIWGKPVSLAYFRKHPEINFDENDKLVQYKNVHDRFFFITVDGGSTYQYTIKVDPYGKYIPGKKPQEIEPEKLQEELDLDKEDDK